MTTSLGGGPALTFETEKAWCNWGRNQSCTAALYAAPRSEHQLLEAVRHAIRSGLNVRVVGAGHSFTPVVATDGLLLSLEHLSGVTSVDPARRRVTAWGGTPISAFGEPLWAAGLSLSNQGDIDTQTIAGAIATGTHGSGIHLASFSGAVRSLRLINGLGDIVEIRETDVEKLHAAQVAIGTLGVVVEVELEVSPSYYLREQITHPTFTELAAHWEDNISSHRHFSFLWCPTDESAPLYELPTPSGESMVDRAYTKVYDAIDIDEANDIGTTEWRRVDRAHRIYPGGFGLPFHELEHFVPASAGLDAVRAVRKLMLTKHTDQLFPIEVRWAAADEAYLSSQYQRDTTVVSVSGAPGTNYWPFLRDVDAVLEDFDARPHWGKIHFTTRQRMERLFPQLDKFVAIRRHFDPNGVYLNDHLRPLLG